MRFSMLLKSAGISPRHCRGEAEVTSVAVDSRQCQAGACFVAVRGWADDGHRYIPAAVSAGSSAVVCEDASTVPPEVAFAAVDDAREALGRLAQAIRGWPARALTSIAITGTNGKTTVAHLIREALAAAGHSPALLGTIRYETALRSVPAVTTTPDPVSLAEMTAEMVAGGQTHLVMEVSSHALDQRRTAGLDFRVAVFTNLSGDHLDYHKTMDRYLAAKRLLFEGLSPDATAVVNRDDDNNVGEAMAKATRAKVLWYGLSPAADLRARIREIDATGTRFDVICGAQEIPVATPLIGRHNVFNWLAAAGACTALGMDLSAVAPALERVAKIRGRLERVDSPAPYQVFVDYAHTDHALANVLSSFVAVKGGRVIVVFGCGGERDRTKRPRMARVAEQLADRIVVTSDNPRNEDPQAIIDEIVAGLGEAGRAKADIEPDRRAAIGLAISQAREGDVVLIAGKGHEPYQILGDRRVQFDDVEVAEEMMRRREEER